jgi:ABC-type protease/lipase transport system fused ATPase/permease subunit
MFRAYVNILAITLGLSNFVVLASALGSGRDVTARDFLVPAAVLFLLVSFVLGVLKLVRLRDSRIITRALSQQRSKIAAFKTTLRDQAIDATKFSQGLKPWNS